MTVKRLNELCHELQNLRDEIKEAEIRADSIPGGKISGMPSAKGFGNSKEYSYLSLIHKKETVFYEKYNKLSIKYSDEIKYIASIKEKTTHDIFMYRFLYGLEWKEVASIIDGMKSADSVRMRVIRYLQKTA